MIPGKPFDPATETSRRPTPEEFDHLRKWVEPITRNIELTSITEITNINQQLEQTATLFINNIISRVIAQIIGKRGDGFVTIEGTADGALHVHIKDIDAAATLAVTLGEGDESIGKVQIEGPGQTVLTAEIDGAAGGNVLSITGVADKKHKITSILLVVAANTDITFLSAGNDLSGPMPLGGTDEPRGMTMNHGNFPLPCGTNEAFIVHSSAAVQVSGYVVYYDEA